MIVCWPLFCLLWSCIIVIEHNNDHCLHSSNQTTSSVAWSADLLLQLLQSSHCLHLFLYHKAARTLQHCVCAVSVVLSRSLHSSCCGINRTYYSVWGGQYCSVCRAHATKQINKCHTPKPKKSDTFCMCFPLRFAFRKAFFSVPMCYHNATVCIVVIDLLG